MRMIRMIYNGQHHSPDGQHHSPGGHHNPPYSQAIAERLAENVAQFRYRQKEDAWLLAAWERAENKHCFIFRYFTIAPNGTVTELNFR